MAQWLGSVEVVCRDTGLPRCQAAHATLASCFLSLEFHMGPQNHGGQANILFSSPHLESWQWKKNEFLVPWARTRTLRKTTGSMQTWSLPLPHSPFQDPTLPYIFPSPPCTPGPQAEILLWATDKQTSTDRMCYGFVPHRLRVYSRPQRVYSSSVRLN